MKLRDLDPEFVTHVPPDTFRSHDDIQGAQGILFQCPECAKGCEQGEEDGRRFYRGAHYVLAWFKNPVGADPVPDGIFPGPGRWTASGSTFDDLTLDPSINLDTLKGKGCRWHGWVKNGEAA